MRKTINQSASFSKRDGINSRSGYPLKDFEGKNFPIKGITAAAVMEDTDEDTGEIKEIGVFRTKDEFGNTVYYTTISATVIDVLEDVIEVIDEESTVDVLITKRKSNSNREFLTLVIE